MQPVAQKIRSLVGGGMIFGQQCKMILVEGFPIGVQGDNVAVHGACPVIPIHCSATLIMGSQMVLAEGIQVCKVGNTASCGDTIMATGTQDVLVGN